MVFAEQFYYLAGGVVALGTLGLAVAKYRSGRSSAPSSAAVLMKRPEGVDSTKSQASSPRQHADFSPAHNSKRIVTARTVVVLPETSHTAEVRLKAGEYLDIELHSDDPVNLDVVDERNLRRLKRDQSYDAEESVEAVLDCELRFEPPKPGIWAVSVWNHSDDEDTMVELRVTVESHGS